MTDAISRSAVLGALTREIGRQMVKKDNVWPFTRDILVKTLEDVCEFVRDTPALNVAPVVRCKDCCYFAQDGESLYCTYHDNINVTEKFFCATGDVKHADARKPV